MSYSTYTFNDSSLPVKLAKAEKVRFDFWNESLGINESVLLEEKTIENGIVAFLDSDETVRVQAKAYQQSSQPIVKTITKTNVAIIIDKSLLPESNSVHLNFKITCTTNEVQKLDHTYYETPDWNAGPSKEGYIKNKPFGVEVYEGVFWELAKPQFESTQDAETGNTYYMLPEIYFNLTDDELGKFYDVCVSYYSGNNYCKVDSVNFVIALPSLGVSESMPLSTSLGTDNVVILEGSSNGVMVQITLVPDSKEIGRMNVYLNSDTESLGPIIETLAIEGSIALDGVWGVDNPIPDRYLLNVLNSLPIRVITFNGDKSNMMVSEIIEAVDNDNAILAVYNSKTYTLNQAGTAEAGSVWTFSCGTNSEEFTVVSTGGVAYLVREYDET